MNLLHPVYHGFSYHIGSRVDLKQELPTNLKDADLDELVESLSTPARFQERIAPLSLQIGNETVRGKNYTDAMIHAYRLFLDMFTNVTAYVRQTMADNFREKGMVPFLSLALEPDVLYRIIETDYDMAENTYGKIMELFSTGVLAPCITLPFHVIAPMLPSPLDIRLCVRIGLTFFWNIVKEHYRYVRKAHGETPFVVAFWLPEGGYSKSVGEILFEEFSRKCSADKITDAHLVLPIDNQQSVEGGNDIMMKSWNVVQLDGRKKVLSVIFKDRSFSDWVCRANPSVKKLLDRTIAKVDADLNQQDIDYCWAHFESFESLAFSAKSLANFEQKIIKLTELGYLTVGPDVFVRRKMVGKFSRARHEPQVISLKENSSAYDWHLDNVSLGRWEGTLDSNARHKLVDENRPYVRTAERGTKREKGSQSWKIAFDRALATCASAVKGNPDKLTDGMLGVLASLVPAKDKKLIRRNVEDFLAHFSYVYWSEHFLQQGYSEADLQLRDVVKTHLLKGCKAKLSDEKTVIAGVAARAYYFALDSARSFATTDENLDQRAAYQNVAMCVLAMVDAIYVYHWRKQIEEAKELVTLLRRELIGFASAYARYKLAEYGVTEAEWLDAIKSQVRDVPMNLVERAARRIAARHLRPLGYRRDFSPEDERITANTGHLWSEEVANPNFHWENPLFCGLKEE
jgi:uncharacterized protein involved in tolerance to divalent cations